MSEQSRQTGATGTASPGSGHAPLDPAAVPTHPVVQVQIRPSDSGVLEGLVDGRVVTTDRDHDRVRRRVIGAAAAVAARLDRPVQAVRVHATAADGSVTSLVVTAAGEVIAAQAPATPARPSTLTPPAPTSAPPPAPAPAPAPAPRAAAVPRPRETPGETRGETPGETPGAAGRSWSGTLRRLAGALVALVLLGGAIAAAVVQFRHDRGDGTAAAPSPVPLPVVAPAPYDGTAAWSVDLGAASLTATEDVVVADEERVYVVRDAGRTVAAYDASTGLPEWTLGLEGDVVAGPALMVVDGETVLAAASPKRLVLLDPETGSAKGDFELPADHRGVRMTATGPVVLIEATHVQVVVDGELTTRVIPATGYPVAPRADGSLVVVGNTGRVWVVNDGRRAGAPRSLPKVKGHVLETAAGWTPSRLVLTYRARRQTGFGSVRLVAVDTRDWSFQWSTDDLPPLWDGPPGEFGLQTGPAGEWGIFGTEAISLDTGRSLRLADDWRTTAIGDTVAFGTGSGRPLVATRDGVTPDSANSPRLNSLTHLTAPQAVAGEERVFLVVNSATDSVLYALRR